MNFINRIAVVSLVALMFSYSQNAFAHKAIKVTNLCASILTGEMRPAVFTNSKHDPYPIAYGGLPREVESISLSRFNRWEIGNPRNTSMQTAVGWSQQLKAPSVRFSGVHTESEPIMLTGVSEGIIHTFSNKFEEQLVTKFRFSAKGTPGLKVRLLFRNEMRFQNEEQVARYFDIELFDGFHEYEVPVSELKTETLSKHFYLNSVASGSPQTFSMAILNPTQNKKFSFTLAGPIIFERDFSDSSNGEYGRILYENYMEKYLPESYQGPGPKKEMHTRGVNLLNKVIANIYDPNKQRKAIDFVLLNDEKVLAQVAKSHGINLVEMSSKTPTIKAFFMMSEASRNHPALPLESGDFAKDHHRLSHVAQFLAAIDGLSEAEIKLYVSFIDRCYTSIKETWAFWGIIIDAPGNTTPNGPRLWRDLMIARAIELGLSP